MSSEDADARNAVLSIKSEGQLEALDALANPLTVKRLAEQTDAPLSSAYRWVRDLQHAGLIAEAGDVQTGESSTAATYVRTMDEISVSLESSEQATARLVTDGGQDVGSASVISPENYDRLNNGLLPHGPRAGRKAAEHWEGEHPETLSLEYAGSCPFCYLKGMSPGAFDDE